MIRVPKANTSRPPQGLSKSKVLESHKRRTDIQYLSDSGVAELKCCGSGLKSLAQGR